MAFNRRERILLILVVLVIGIFVGDKLIVTPLDNIWKSRSSRIDELTRRLDNGRLLVEREAPISQRWQEMKRQGLHKDASMAEDAVLEAVSRWTQASRLNVTSINPRWADQREDFKTLEFRLNAIGDIDAITRFIYELENEPIGLKIEDIDITSRDDSGRRLNLGLRFTGIMLLDERT